MSTNYVKKIEGGDYISTLVKPVYGKGAVRTKAENPDVYYQGKWFNSTNGTEKVVNGDFDGGATGWVVGASFTISNGRLINTGVSYGSFTTSASSLNIPEGIWVQVTFEGACLLSIHDGTAYVGVVNGDSLYVEVGGGSLRIAGAAGDYIDNISVFETAVTPDTAYSPQITYLPVELEVDASGQPVLITETKKVEVVAEKIVADVYGWANDGIPYIDEDAIGANPTATLYPDGTIVGSTSNGSYTKYPNGDLECYLARTSAGTTPASNGALWIGASYDWKYPILFIEVANIVSLNAKYKTGHDPVSCSSLSGTVNTTSTFYGIRSWYAVGNLSCTSSEYYSAKGRWK